MLEQAIKDLTEAVKAQTALLAEGLNRQADKPAAPKTEAPKAEAADAPATKPAGTRKSRTPKPLSADDVKAAFVTYRDKGPGDKDTRMANIRSVNEHFGVKKISDTSPDNFAEAVGYIKELEAGKKPSFMSEDSAAEEAEEDEGEALV